jgi:hypothetical protein
MLHSAKMLRALLVLITGGCTVWQPYNTQCALIPMPGSVFEDVFGKGHPSCGLTHGVGLRKAAASALFFHGCCRLSAQTVTGRYALLVLVFAPVAVLQTCMQVTVLTAG